MDAIKVENLSKRYAFYPNSKHLFREILPWKSESPFGEKWAVREISFTISEGQACAVIGGNGSGKSTLLGLLSGVIRPTSGSIANRGNVSSILELGAGFRLELTGRQNIWLNASLLGLPEGKVTRELENIVGFSELGPYVDKPVKTYSAGMLLRLGFSIAVHMEFDILLIDEILSVGDLLFRRKCIKIIRDFKRRGKTILLATHSLADVAGLCDRVLLLDDGRITQDGPVEDVIRRYWQECERNENLIHKGTAPFRPESIHGRPTGRVRISRVRFFNKDQQETDTFETAEEMTIRIGYAVQEAVRNPLFRVQFFKNDGLWVYGANTYRQGLNLGNLEKDGEIKLCFKALNLLEADYFVSVGIWPDEYKSFVANMPYDLHELAYVIHVKSSREKGAGVAFSPCRWSVVRNGDPMPR